MIRLIIPGEPHVLNRPRFTTAGGFSRAYDSQKSEKNEVIFLMLHSLGRQLPSEDHLIITLQFYLKPSQSDVDANLKAWGMKHNSSKDLDNMIKFYLDCGNGVLWKDDKQIIKIIAERKFSSIPKTVIKIEELSEIVGGYSMSILNLFSQEEMEQFILQARSLPEFSMEKWDDMSSHEKEIFQQCSSKKILDFCEKWIDKIKKVVKKVKFKEEKCHL